MNKLLILLSIFSLTFFGSCKKSCDDGKQNQKEEQTDCGGPCKPCATCNDGIINGKETDVDCGGPDCIPCDVLTQWKKIDITTSEELIDIDADNQLTVVIGRQGSILTSTDKGLKWNKNDQYAGTELKSVQITGSKIFVAGNGGKLLVSSDGGSSFTDISISGVANDWNDLLFFSEDSGLVCGADLEVYFTQDGGKNWVQKARTPFTKRKFYAMSSPDGVIVYALGDYKLIESKDKGFNWAEVSLSDENPDMEGFTDLHYISTTRAFAAGEASILLSGNSESWHDKALRTKFGGFSFNGQNAIYAGRNQEDTEAKLLESKDNGITWNTLNTPDKSIRLNDCYIIDENTALAIGEKGTIYRRSK